MQKSCNKCHQLQPLTDFYRDKKSPDGHTWYCKTCMKQHTRQWYAKNQDRAIASAHAFRVEHPDKFKERTKKYYDAHPEKYRQRSRTYVQQHPDKVRESKRRYHAENGEKIKKYRQEHRERDSLKAQARRKITRERDRARLRAWRQANPELSSSYILKRRALRLNAPINDLTLEQWREIKAAYNHECVYCGEKKPLTQDHLTPLSAGGSHTVQNIVPACKSCNSKKFIGKVPIPIQPLLLTLAKKKAA